MGFGYVSAMLVRSRRSRCRRAAIKAEANAKSSKPPKSLRRRRGLLECRGNTAKTMPPPKIYLEVSVINPITRKAADGELVTTYAIYVETNDSAFTMSRSMVRRRYSEFVALRSLLQEQHPSYTVPRLPGKTILGKRFDQRFIQDRCSGLQAFLRAIVDEPVYLSNKSLHLFLQTSLTMREVCNVANGCVSFELPHNNCPPLLLRAVDSKLPMLGNSCGRVGILKQEACVALASCPQRDCQVNSKHQHMRVGSGIVVCPYAIDGGGASGGGGGAGAGGRRGSNGASPSGGSGGGSGSGQQMMSGSAPFNVPAGSPKVATRMRTCASDTCLDGPAAAAGTGTAVGSLGGSKKRVSFLLEKDCEKKKGSKAPKALRRTPTSNPSPLAATDRASRSDSSGSESNGGVPVKPAAEPKQVVLSTDGSDSKSGSSSSNNNSGSCCNGTVPQPPATTSTSVAAEPAAPATTTPAATTTAMPTTEEQPINTMPLGIGQHANHDVDNDTDTASDSSSKNSTDDVSDSTAGADSPNYPGGFNHHDVIGDSGDLEPRGGERVVG